MIRALLLAAALAGPVATPETPRLATIPLGGAFIRPGTGLDAALWTQLAHVTVRAVGHSGVRATYDGVRLADVLHDAGAPVGAAVRGKAARAYVLVSAADGYSVIFSLAELDPPATNCAPAIVYARDGVALSDTDGPVAIVAPCDRTHARWIHGVTRITVTVAGEEAAATSTSQP